MPWPFGSRLRACRCHAGLSQQELAERSGVSIRTISNLERGRAQWPHHGTVHRLADALELLLRRDGDAPLRPRHSGWRADDPDPLPDGAVAYRQITAPGARPGWVSALGFSVDSSTSRLAASSPSG